MNIKFTGIRELKIALKRNIEMDDVKRIVRKNGGDMQAKTQQNAPVDTGALKQSIGLEITDGGLTATVEPKVEYASYQEYGTRFMEAQPFVGPAFNEQKEKFKRDIDKLMK